MDSCVFSYYICESNIEIEELKCAHKFGKYSVQVDARTPLLYAHNDNSECIIFGYAVNVFTSECDSLAENILSCCSDFSEVIEFEKSLGGKYVILYRHETQYYVLGDATCSIPIFYNINGEFACTSNQHYLVEQYNYLPDREFQSIREASDISQAMPFDITQYREIKQLLPNHYLSINERRAVRFVNSDQKQTFLSVEEATELTLPMIETICGFYKRRFEIHCPITSGRDSRVVLAFLADCGDEVHCYTIKHTEHHEDTQDIVIPRLLCVKNNIPYEQIQDVTISKNLKEEMDQLLGANSYSLRTLCIAQTIHEHYGSGAIITGDIIGQVGKCSLHRDIPLCFATPNYFRCKLHNYSDGAKKQLGLWIKEINNSGEHVNIFDLFSIENRLGRWAAQENLIYNSIGQKYLNVFNSRSIIYLWTAVNRKDRKKSKIHIILIKKINPKLLDTPFEHESIITRISKLNGMIYLLSSYVKYLRDQMKFKKEKAYEKDDSYS